MTQEEKYLLSHKIIDNVVYRKCSKCNQWIEENVDNFYMVNKSYPEKGFTARCKLCSVEDGKEYIKNNHEKVLRRWHETMSKGNRKEIHKEQIKKWFAKNEENRKEYMKDYWQSNPDKVH